MNKNQLIEYFKRENENFSFENFFTDEDNDLDKRAIIVITPNQIIKTRTPIIGDSKKRADHEPTYNNLTCLLYNIGFNSDDNLIDYNKLSKDYKNYIDYLQYNQNIAIIMCNVGVNHLKLVLIHIPSLISYKQLELLESIENEQGLLLKEISKEINNESKDSLVIFSDFNNKIIKCDSFSAVINYIKSNNMINDDTPRLDEEIIFSDLENINLYRDRK